MADDFRIRSSPSLGSAPDWRNGEEGKTRLSISSLSVLSEDLSEDALKVGTEDHDDGDAEVEAAPFLVTRAVKPSAKSGSKPKPKESLVDVSPARFYTILVMVNVQMFIASFDATIISTSHPVITSYFQASHLAPWLYTAFMLTSIGLNPVVTALADPIGRRRLELFFGVTFVFGTVWCALAQSMLSFIFARALCGFTVVGWSILGNVLLADLVADENRGTWQAVANLAFGSGAASGVAMGGIMADCLGWRWEFGIQVPIIAVLTLIGLVVPGDLGRQGAPRQTMREAMRSFDYLGCFLISLASASFVLLANIGGNVVPWSHPVVPISLATSIAAGVLFIRAETTAVKPVYPLRLVASAPFRHIVGGTVLFTATQNGLYFNVPLYFQAALLNTPTLSGLWLMVPTSVNMLFGIGSCLGIRQWGYISPWIKAGPVFLTAGAVAACFFSRSWPDWAYLVALFPIGAGVGLFFPPASIAAVAHTEQRDQPATAGLCLLGRSLGGVAGVSGFGLVMQNSLLHYLDRYVEDGPAGSKAEVVGRVHKSVDAARDLEGPQLEQVIRSYVASLRVTFASVVVLGLICVPVVMSMRLNRIGSQSREQRATVGKIDSRWPS